MPTVPRRTAPAATTSALPTMRAAVGAPAAAFGAPGVGEAIGQGLAPVAQVAERLYARERQKADNTALRDADNKMGALRRSLLEDANAGYFAMRGKDAMEGAEKVTAEWQKGVSEIERGLTTDEQRQRFAAYAAQQHDQMSVAVQRHLRQEIDRDEQEVAETTIQSAMDDALANYADPDAVGAAIGKAVATMRDFGRGRGVRPEVLERQVATQASKAHVAVIGRFLDTGQDIRAREYYEAHQDGIVGGQRGAVEKALDVGSTRGEGQRRADAIMSARSASGEAITRGEAYEAAKAITDARVRAETEDRLTLAFARRDADERDRYEQTTETAWSYIDAGQSVPVSVWTALKAPQRAAIRAYQKATAKGEEPQTDWARYYELQTEAAVDETRDAFLKRNLFAERGRLGDTEFKELIGLQGAMRKRDATADAKLDGILSDLQTVNDIARAAGMDPGAKENNKKVAAYRLTVARAVKAEEQRTGKKLSSDEVARIAGALMVKGVVHGGGWWAGTKRAFEQSPGDSVEYRIEDIPKDVQSRIEAAIRRDGRAPTDANIVDAFTKWVRRTQGATP